MSKILFSETIAVGQNIVGDALVNSVNSNSKKEEKTRQVRSERRQSMITSEMNTSRASETR